MIKRSCVVVGIFLFLFSVLCLPSCAATDSERTVDEMLDEFYETIPEQTNISKDDDIIARIGFEALLSDVINAFMGERSRVVRFFLLVFGLAVMMSIAGGLKDSSLQTGRGVSSAVEIGVCTVGAATVFTYMYTLCQTVRESLVSLCDFFSLIIPIMTAVSASSGAVATAGVHATNMNITLAVISRISVRILMPIAFLLFSLAVIGVFSDGGVASVASGIKSFFYWGIGLLSAVSTAAIAMQSVVASAKDSASLRAARYAASGLIPIVGSTVASALSTLAGGLAFAKSTIGATSIVVILTLAIAPLLSLLLYRLAFSVTLSFLNFAGCTGGVRCFSAFRSALDSLIAIYALSIIVCILEIVIFMKSGVSVF